MHLPGHLAGEGQPVSSAIGSASMSARIASVGPGRPPSITPTTPVRPSPVRCGIAMRASSAATMPAVRVSSKASSGCAWMSRRIATSAAPGDR
jgi:hypothetical protein